MATEKAVKAITITLDGREVSGPPGMTVLELSREAGVHIPTLCYHESLPSSGACRLCLVEEEKTKALLASCVTPIAPGMVINTKSPRVLERRKTIVELMLSSHPDSCLVCDKGNRCQLRQVAAEMGIGWIGLERIPQLALTDEVNPFIERDLAKCILCGKCIRACQELVVEGAIDYFQRGFVTRPATLGNQPLERSECTFCGTCVALCPTGAITEREKSYRGSTANAVQTTCPFCGCGCGITLEVRDNRLVRAVPTDQGRPLCVRGSYGTDFIHSPERLTRPLVKKDGEFVAVSWDEALAAVAEKLGQVKQQHGADSLAVLGSPRCTNEENYLLQRFARSLLGTGNIDNGARVYGAAAHVALHSLGLNGSKSNLDTLEQSDVIMVIGSDPSSSAPAAGYVIKRAARSKKARLVLVDPRETKLALFSQLWLRPEVDSDVALINGLMKVIIDEGLVDKELASKRAGSLQSLTEGLESYTPDQVERLTGVQPQALCEAARLLAGAERAAIVFGSGITQHANGTDGVAALANLALLTGKARLYPLEKESNARGAADMGTLPGFLPGYGAVEDAAARAKFEERWGAKLPVKAGLSALDMIEKAAEGDLKGMYIVGENPVLSFPAPSVVRRALSSLDFLVVQDMFLTETARLAGVVLPAASFAEKDGTVTSFEGKTRVLRKAVEPPRESLPDWQIILKLADKMGNPLPYSSPEEVREEIKEMVPGYGTAPDAVRGNGRPVPVFSPVHYVKSKDRDGGYPFILITGGTLYQFAGGSRTSQSARLKKFSGGAFIEMSEQDARKLSLKAGDQVTVASAHGRAGGPVKVTTALPAGVLFMPASFPDSPVNQLFDIVLDPESRSPRLKACRVKIVAPAKPGVAQEEV